MNRRLTGKVALVIGGARGIGAGIAARFAEEGARVVIADMLSAEGAATSQELHGDFISVDVSVPNCKPAVAMPAHGGLDILVQIAASIHGR